MKTTLVLYPSTKEQIKAFKAVAKAMSLPFYRLKKKYNPDFVKRVLRSRDNVKNGEYTEIQDVNNIWTDILPEGKKTARKTKS